MTAIKSPVHRQFFGDREYDFALPPKLIAELEHKTGAGLGKLCRRVFDAEFSYDDLRETIRLALIGGGVEPYEAARLVTVYVEGVPLSQTYPLAVSILETIWFGKAQEDNSK
jgi:hypothetical protein